MEKFWGIFLQGGLACLIGTGIYIAIGLILKTHEMIIFIETIKNKLVRAKDLPSDITEINEV
jgi:ABC-type lipoprotein release transport system permease subunit